MPNLEDLDSRLTVKDVKMGDLLIVADAGEIVEFEDRKTRKLVKRLKMGFILPNGKIKSGWVNNYSKQNLGDAWGLKTEEWEGKTAIVSFQKSPQGDYMVLYPAPTRRDDGLTQEVVPF